MVDSLHWDGIDDLNSAYNSSQIGEMGAIFLSQDDGNACLRLPLVNFITRAHNSGLENEDPYEHLRSFVEE